MNRTKFRNYNPASQSDEIWVYTLFGLNIHFIMDFVDNCKTQIAWDKIVSILILTVFRFWAFYDHGQPDIRQAAQLCISKNVTFGRCQRCLAKRRRHYLTISVSIRCHHLLIRNYAALLLTWFPSSSSPVIS